MKKLYLGIVKKFFRGRLIQTRHTLGLTQAGMARKLLIEDRSYSALESGESCCGALTLVLFLLYCCENPTAFLENLRKEFDRASSNAA